MNFEDMCSADSVRTKTYLGGLGVSLLAIFSGLDGTTDNELADIIRFGEVLLSAMTQIQQR